ncbi:MAG: adenylosuccinate synthetase, adenylosuccinate synthase [Candidatus Peregrinibacteria bacterium GW2011_GWF2_33_10]|nr:MAG: adenylosuccinate synthetase, adenylosuccinate synthase [Candidatus Peregrinibacteria bacterium GW2011_GWF2_33_10]
MSQITIILGAQWGDEGKGKLVDILSEKFDIITRSAGGANAGHSVYIGDQKHVFHLIPSGILNNKTVCVIGNGCVIHIETLLEEINNLKSKNIKTENRIFISDRAHILFDYHKVIDGKQEEMKGKLSVGTTKRGIGPCYEDKISRRGIRFCDLMEWEIFEEKIRNNVKILSQMYGDLEFDLEKELNKYKEYSKTLKEMIIDTTFYLNASIQEGKTLLLEGANAIMLDVDHGTYPYVTSSNPSIGGIYTGLGIAPQKNTEVIGIVKAYTTRVGAGPFPTEQENEIGEHLRQVGGEYGSTTGRPRRCGWLDAVMLKYSMAVNHYDIINLTKIDCLTGLKTLKIAVSYYRKGEKLNSWPASLQVLKECEVEYLELPGWDIDISACRNFEELPVNCKNYILKIEELMQCRIKYIGVGVRRDQIIIK